MSQARNDISIELARSVARIYEQVEYELLRKIARRLARGATEPGWAEAKMQEIVALRAELAAIIAWLQRNGASALDDAAIQAYIQGDTEARLDLRRVYASAARLQADRRTTLVAARAYADANKQTFLDSHLSVYRGTEDVYRSIIAKAAQLTTTGTITTQEAMRRALYEFTDRGITRFVDRRGRSWGMQEYADMAVRTAVTRAYIQGSVDQYQQNGHNLVIVSNSPEECSLCRPWEGKILSLSGRQYNYISNSYYPSIQEATAAGLFHPGCTHRVNAYIPGLTREMEGTENPKGYEERQKQRDMERTIRQYKRRKVAAQAVSDTQRAREAQEKIDAWTDALEAYIKEKDRTRRRDREGIARGIPYASADDVTS
jgi:hypothetical protein